MQAPHQLEFSLVGENQCPPLLRKGFVRYSLQPVRSQKRHVPIARLHFWQTAKFMLLPRNLSPSALRAVPVSIAVAIAVAIAICVLGRLRPAGPLRDLLQCRAQTRCLDFSLNQQTNLHRRLHAKRFVPGNPSIYYFFIHEFVLTPRSHDVAFSTLRPANPHTHPPARLWAFAIRKQSSLLLIRIG